MVGCEEDTTTQAASVAALHSFTTLPALPDESVLLVVLAAPAWPWFLTNHQLLLVLLLYNPEHHTHEVQLPVAAACTNNHGRAEAVCCLTSTTHIVDFPLLAAAMLHC